VPNGADIVIRLLVAFLLGGLIGLERERHERAAGLRTVTMVSLGSCLFTLMSLFGFHTFDSSLPANLRADPGRVAAQIVTGIGFLGAGTIFLRKDLVRGLTTAATIWATAAIGMAAGAGEYFAAAFTTLLILIVLMALKPIERRFFKRLQGASLSLVLPRADDSLDRVRRALQALGAHTQSIHVHEISESEDKFEMEVDVPAQRSTADLLHQLRRLEGARSVLVFQEFTEERSHLTP
jgi:putative Mg2+ transporter-C (MgtC) family protein